jgi:hypothetical protein
MENNIAMAVINALKTPQAIAMDTETSEEMSNQSTATETITTMKTLEDKFDALSTMVHMLAERMSEIVEQQEANQNKRTRPADSPTKQILKPPTSSRKPAQSPPAKIQKAAAPQPPTTPPPNGFPSSAGTREGK